LHVVALNWRDLANPLGGGAEIHMEEILRHLARRGHRCTLLTSRFPGAARDEQANGYRILRGGGEYTFNFAAPGMLRRVMREDPADVVLDDVNKIPLYSPLYSRAPVVAVVPHLMGASVFHEVNPVLATAVFAAEQPVRFVYRHCHFEVISESTRDELVARGWEPERITVVHCGIDRETYQPAATREKPAGPPRLVFVGRLKRYKFVDHAIRLVARLRAAHPGVTLTVVGSGDGRPNFEALVRTLGLGDAVRFAGFVSTEEKVRLLQDAHVLVNPSMKEGWGLTNVEASACGTTVVAADVPGLRDSVLDGRTGLLYPHGDLDALTAATDRLLRDPDERRRMEAEGLRWADRLTWARCGDETLALLERVLAGRGR
jgi:glycosyltransferase involved in cell wall biosynthesis